ncbi:uncharacterized protein BO87DRAFT_62976 [Aspergillus neoniger CBS 115656]|uniref:Uncharacterized protein n=1 Tax=Aspergillus neoniger (strain CBS 115656) TaxID=1448310 RepID=A0A318YMY4_ASPNB|nr:hypothetical protein BO87DRAFT_62976 [Aspergillus neoniger CBS 115656]PYH34093.1 hypothetical protein BO87DRAFT_62976 [Aspergillus neoniger CBS 115656]
MSKGGLESGWCRLSMVAFGRETRWDRHERRNLTLLMPWLFGTLGACVLRMSLVGTKRLDGKKEERMKGFS